MKKTRIFCFLLSFLLLSGWAAGYSLAVNETKTTHSDAAVTNGCHSLDAVTAFLGTDPLTENAASAVLYETGSDTLMYAWNPDARAYPSSLVKILTALLAVQKGDPEEIITVSESVLATVPYDAVSAELQPDEQMRLGDLLYCMMVGSANDAAAVIAAHIAGDQDSFVQQMNAYAQELGCTATQFKNVHGLHDEEQYTTARDMARILAAATESDLFTTYFSTVHYTVPATNKSEARELSTGNFLMNSDHMEIYYDSRVTGGRTGIAEDGTRCLAASAQGNGLQLISIVMGAESTYTEDGNTMTYGSFKETSALLDVAFDGCKAAQILFQGQALRQCSVLGGTSDVVLGSQVSVSAILPEDVQLADLAFRYTDVPTEIQAPIKEGDILSHVQVWFGNICIAQADLVAMNAVPVAVNASENAQNHAENKGWYTALFVVLWVLAGVGIVVAIVWLTRRIRIVVLRRRTKRYRRDRRRSR